MKKIVFVLCLLVSLRTFAQGDQITGLYWSPKKDAKIEIYKKGGQYFGRSVWVANPRKDIKNPNEALKKREVLGIDLFSGFIYKDGTYTSGKVYDPEDGKTYDCKMNLNGEVLKVRGYIGISLFGRTEYFKRIRS
ncbi:DUF2147 domain-containing protein [Mucilaginibacter sp. UR6-11]|uniref:DUF2147 domain-containing protein n=1 Tax=Mucilaginibacter sp. UR6-11 TaxID=1435644 RepID=UPI001E5DDEC9|nr:DUF2147 domain-containing protein [Mucilaginibacter sp. UR6-11]MCC8423507.1 DUF2147 domain-containing protein [Mucilaginibacter sp. UR6-11]